MKKFNHFERSKTKRELYDLLSFKKDTAAACKIQLKKIYLISKVISDNDVTLLFNNRLTPLIIKYHSYKCGYHSWRDNENHILPVVNKTSDNPLVYFKKVLLVSATKLPTSRNCFIRFG